MTVELTPAQARAVTWLAARKGLFVDRSARVDEHERAGDLYATPHGSTTGYRIATDGTLNEIGETPAAPRALRDGWPVLRRTPPQLSFKREYQTRSATSRRSSLVRASRR